MNGFLGIAESLQDPAARQILAGWMPHYPNWWANRPEGFPYDCSEDNYLAYAEAFMAERRAKSRAWLEGIRSGRIQREAFETVRHRDGAD